MRRTILATLTVTATALFYGLIDSATAMDGEAEQAETQDVAEAGAPVVGEPLAAEDTHLIADQGRYGLGTALPGTRYAVADGWLVRVDASSLTVQSRLWQHGSLD